MQRHSLAVSPTLQVVNKQCSPSSFTRTALSAPMKAWQMGAGVKSQFPLGEIWLNKGKLQSVINSKALKKGTTGSPKTINVQSAL